jgi:GT2 family glycosyltransferase
MVDLSIIIINYNTFDLTMKCISSIYKYTSGLSFEIILVDNKSTECDPQKFAEQFTNIKLIQNNKNAGFARGNNIGISSSIGNAILLLNSDTELVDNSIFYAFQELINEQSRKIGVVTGKLLYPDGSLQHQCGRFPSIYLQLIELFRIQKILPKRVREDLLLGGFFDHTRPIFPDWIWGTFFMFNREILNSFPEKKLTETYFMYQEDLEWCYLINKRGFKILYDPSICVIHHFGSSSSSNSEIKLKWLNENLADFILRYYGKFFLIFYSFLQKTNRSIGQRILFQKA